LILFRDGAILAGLIYGHLLFQKAKMMKPKSVKKICIQQELHTGHMCELESRQEWEIIRQISENPSVRCENCGAQVNSARNVCMPADLGF
jgi:hypothetical protein